MVRGAQGAIGWVSWGDGDGRIRAAAFSQGGATGIGQAEPITAWRNPGRPVIRTDPRDPAGLLRTLTRRPRHKGIEARTRSPRSPYFSQFRTRVTFTEAVI
ncbi:hypothetical protein GCM10018966_039630 [Streptomyces yanii]